MAWQQLRVHSRYPEFADEILQAQGAQAVSFIDAQDDPVLEPGPGETPLWKDTVTLGLFPDRSDLAPVIASLREQLPDGASLQIGSELVEDQDWVRVWLEDCPPLKFGERLWVCPREKRVDEPGTATLLLDPGLAFGTGTHPSTALCLDWLATHDPRGWQVLDYGCGSGILAIAALKLGAARAVAYDIDPQALTATRDNTQVNGVRERLVAVEPGDEFVPFPADLVLANILARPLIELAPLLASSVARGGRIVLAGLLERQADDVRAAYAPWFDFQPDVVREGWTRLEGICREPAIIALRHISPRLATAGQPRPEHFTRLRDEGFEAVINLAMPGSPNALPDEAERVRALGMSYRAIPVEWTAPTPAHLREFCAAMDDLGAGRALVHCALNKRASAFVFLWRVLHCGEPIEPAAQDLFAIWNPEPTWARFVAERLAEHGLAMPPVQASRVLCPAWPLAGA